MVEEVLPAANPDSVTTNTSRSVPINNVTTISTSQATCVGPSVMRTVTSSTTRMSSTVSSSSVNGTLSSPRYSPRKRPISFVSHHDRVGGIHHHSSGRSRSRSRSPRPLNTNFRIPLLSRENERKDKRRYKESNDRHPAKYPCPHLASFTRRQGRTGPPGNLALARWAGWSASPVGRHVKC